jgi:hypothetical protein
MHEGQMRQRRLGDRSGANRHRPNTEPDGERAEQENEGGDGPPPRNTAGPGE